MVVCLRYGDVLGYRMNTEKLSSNMLFYVHLLQAAGPTVCVRVCVCVCVREAV